MVLRRTQLISELLSAEPPGQDAWDKGPWYGGSGAAAECPSQDESSAGKHGTTAKSHVNAPFGMAALRWQ